MKEKGKKLKERVRGLRKGRYRNTIAEERKGMLGKDWMRRDRRERGGKRVEEKGIRERRRNSKEGEDNERKEGRRGVRDRKEDGKKG